MRLALISQASSGELGCVIFLKLEVFLYSPKVFCVMHCLRDSLEVKMLRVNFTLLLSLVEIYLIRGI